MTKQPSPWAQLRPWPEADPGFRLNPDGTARFRHTGHLVDVLVRYTTEEDRTTYSATGDEANVIVFASVDVGGVTVGRSWWVTDWNNPYHMRDALAYVLPQAVDEAERTVDKMTAELTKIRATRQGEVST